MIDADIATAPRIEPLPERFECFENERILTVNDSADQSRWHTSELRALSRLEKARTHVSLPRDSVRRSTRFNTSGPNGVITANNHSEVWAAEWRSVFRHTYCYKSCNTNEPYTGH